MDELIPLEKQIAEVRRELAMRRHVYPRFVANDRLTQAQADERIAVLEAVRATLEGLRPPPPQAGLFAADDLKGLPPIATVCGGDIPF